VFLVYLIVWFSVPLRVQSTAWKDLSLKWPICVDQDVKLYSLVSEMTNMCFTHSLTCSLASNTIYLLCKIVHKVHKWSKIWTTCQSFQLLLKVPRCVWSYVPVLVCRHPAETNHKNLLLVQTKDEVQSHIIIIIIIIIYLLKDDTIKQARITVKRAGQQGVIICSYKCPKLHNIYSTLHLWQCTTISKY